MITTTNILVLNVLYTYFVVDQNHLPPEILVKVSKQRRVDHCKRKSKEDEVSVITFLAVIWPAQAMAAKWATEKPM